MYSNDEYLLTLLQDAGLVGDKEMAAARGQKKSTESLLDAMVKSGIVSDEQVAKTIAVNSGMEFVDLHGYVPNPDMKAVVPEDVARRYKIGPLGISPGGSLQLAIPDPYDFETLDALPHVLQPDIEFFCSTPVLIRALNSNLYGNEQEISASIGADGDAPVIRLCQNILFEAIKNRASDIHIEPLEKDIRIRYRIDGVLHDVEHHPKRLLSAMISRYKIMTGSMNIDEKRVPQDGRIQTKYQDKELDLRVSMIPTNHGESVVMRILDKSSLRLGLSDLGFLSDDQEMFERMITLPDGIILVTGPTGSGKTTTLYACLNFINRPDRKIITVEDPVEYQLAGINQVMVKEDVGMTFAAALRSMLRQAPNIIMIGEIRDMETAGIAINAALTGHLVFSTLHTNDAPSAITRLMELGVPSYLINAVMLGVLAQRLVRTLCPLCKQPDASVTREKLAEFVAPWQITGSVRAYRPVGCVDCRMTGYMGRMGLYELLSISEEFKARVNKEPVLSALRRQAVTDGMRPLRLAGALRVAEGVTTIEEVLSATPPLE